MRGGRPPASRPASGPPSPESSRGTASTRASAAAPSSLRRPSGGRGGSLARMGIYVDGQLRWLVRAAGWSIAIGYEPDTLVGRIEARHDELGIALACADAVDFHEALYVREIVVRNLRPTPRKMRLFF